MEDFIRKVPKVFQLKEIKIIYAVGIHKLLPYTNNGVISFAKESVMKILWAKSIAS